MGEASELVETVGIVRNKEPPLHKPPPIYGLWGFWYPLSEPDSRLDYKQ